MKDQKLFIVTMYRWGNRDAHSYFLGAYSKKEDAVKAGEDNHDYRGGKYDPEVLEVDVNRLYVSGFGSSWPETITALYGEGARTEKPQAAKEEN